MYTKTPKVTQPKGKAPVITSIQKATNTGLKLLKVSAKRIPHKISPLTAKKSKIGYSNL